MKSSSQKRPWSTSAGLGPGDIAALKYPEDGGRHLVCFQPFPLLSVQPQEMRLAFLESDSSVFCTNREIMNTGST